MPLEHPDRSAPIEKFSNKSGVSDSSSTSFDGDTLKKRVDEDLDFCRELVDGFLADASRQIAELEVAFASEDLVTLRHGIHTFKGVAANLEAGRLREIAAEIEHCLENNERVQAKALLGELARALTRFAQDARNYFSEQDRL